MDYYNWIIESVKEDFDLSIPGFSCSQQSRVYMFFLIKSGLILYQDVAIHSAVLSKLIDENIVKPERGDYFHQMQKCIRYRFVDYKYPSKFYRNVSKKLREIVFEKDNYRCVECGDFRNLSSVVMGRIYRGV